MKWLILLLLVAAEASVLRNNDSLERPQIINLIGSYPALTVVWKTVPSSPTNPVRAYKVSLWEQRTQIVISLEVVNGEKVWVEREELVKFTGAIPDWEPNEEVTVPGSSSNIAHFANLRRGVTYEVRVQAVSLREHSAWSLHSRIQF